MVVWGSWWLADRSVSVWRKPPVDLEAFQSFTGTDSKHLGHSKARMLAESRCLHVAASFCAGLASKLLRQGLVRLANPTETLPTLEVCLVLPRARVSTRDKRPYATDNRNPGPTVRPTKAYQPNPDFWLFPNTQPRRRKHLRHCVTTSPRVQI